MAIACRPVQFLPHHFVVATKNGDGGAAEAICEAALRPTMRFVRPKSLGQQAMQMLHRARELLIRQSTMLVNALRGHLAEFGITAGPRAS
jgi:transposase